MTSPIPFSGSRLDRASEHRSDPEWIAGCRRDPDALVWPFRGLEPLLCRTGDTGGSIAACLPIRTAIPDDAGLTVFLGLEDGRPLFATSLPRATANAVSEKRPHTFFSDARSAASLLPAPETAILGQAKAVLDWHQRHRFCPNCGAPTEFADGGYRRHCPSCGADHFPRTDPVVIMLAVNGDACLVGRSPRFAEGMFSALAGFVEQGESIEEAVAREIHEEAGVRVRDVTYFASQPWPFPSSLMIGCFAEADSRELTIDSKELAEAFWLPRSDLRALFAGEPVRNLRIPSEVAIAHHLLRNFAEIP